MNLKTASPTKKRRRHKRKKSMVDDLKSDLKSQIPAANRKAVLESKHKRKEAEEKEQGWKMKNKGKELGKKHMKNI